MTAEMSQAIAAETPQTSASETPQTSAGETPQTSAGEAPHITNDQNSDVIELTDSAIYDRKTWDGNSLKFINFRVY